MKNQLNKEVSQKQKIKITDLYNNSVFFVSRALDDEMIDKLSKTALKLVLKLNRYFSSETGQRNQRKEYSVTELRKELAINQKDISLKCVLDIVEQIRVNKLFFIFDGFYGKEKTFTFFLPSLKNEELFEAVEKDKGYFKNKMATHFFENNIKNLPLKNENSSSNSENSSSDFKNSSSSFWNSSSNSENSSSNFEEVKSIENTEKIEQLESCQEAYIKEALYKEALHNIEENKILMEQKGNDAMNAFLKKGNDLREEKTNNDNDSTNQKLDTLKNEANQISEIIKSDEKTKESVGNSDKELDELDRIKQILIYDYGFTDASKIIKQYSVKCFNECIDMTIQAEYDSKIKTSAGAYLRTKLKNWSEIIIDHEKVLSNGKNLPPAKKVIEKTYLLGEISFIEFMKSKKYLTHSFNQDINNAVKTMIYNLHYEKANMIEFKELFTKEMIDAFINKVEIENRFFSTNLNGLWYRDLKFNDEKTLFWNAFNNPDLLPEPKKLNEKILNDNLFSEIKKKESEKNISDTKDDFIP